MIRAGKISEISASPGDWLILDIGFSNRAASCGLMINLNPPLQLQFGETVDKICAFIAAATGAVNLVIEAPLSVAFDAKGNPKGRAIEKMGKHTRFWYTGPGSAVMLASLYLVNALEMMPGQREIRLFEGFVSFKEKRGKSDHLRDVIMLREIVDHPQSFAGSIIGPDALKMDETDTLQSAFRIAGMDTGIPPVLMRNG